MTFDDFVAHCRTALPHLEWRPLPSDGTRAGSCVASLTPTVDVAASYSTQLSGSCHLRVALARNKGPLANWVLGQEQGYIDAPAGVPLMFQELLEGLNLAMLGYYEQYEAVKEALEALMAPMGVDGPYGAVKEATESC
jgi:hypothetical protein